MSFVAWIFLGLISGFIASKVVNGSGQGLLRDMVLGVVGAIVGGGAFHLLGQAGVTGFNIRSLLVAVVGAVLLLMIYHAISPRRSRT